jgi:hypothetical protein
VLYANDVLAPEIAIAACPWVATALLTQILLRPYKLTHEGQIVLVLVLCAVCCRRHLWFAARLYVFQEKKEKEDKREDKIRQGPYGPLGNSAWLAGEQ